MHLPNPYHAAKYTESTIPTITDMTQASGFLSAWRAPFPSLFTSTVRMYEVHNNGGWYDFGFILGAMIAFGGSAGGTAARRRRR